MDHHHHPDRPRRQTPRVLPDKVLLGRRAVVMPGVVLELDLEQSGEVLPQVVRCSALDAAPVRRNERLHCGRVDGSSKLLALRLPSLDDRARQQFLVNADATT